MQAKGQLFTTDFLIGMIIVILGFGLMTAQLEFTMYQNKETTNYNELAEKAESATITLSDANWSACDINRTSLAYSIDINKINSLNEHEIKKRIGLTDYNANITLTSPTLTKNIITEIITNKNIYSIDLNVLTCTNDANFTDLNYCLNYSGAGNCNTNKIWMSTLKIKVGK